MDFALRGGFTTVTRRGAARFQEWSPELVTLSNYYHVLTADDDDESYADDEDFTVDNSTSTHAAASTPLLLTDTIIVTTTNAAVSSSTNDDDWEIFITEASDSSDETAQTTEADEASADGDDGTYDDLPELRVIEPSQETSPSLSETLQVAAATTRPCLSAAASRLQAANGRSNNARIIHRIQLPPTFLEVLTGTLELEPK